MTKLYAGLDVSLEMTSICIIDEEGRIRHEGKGTSVPEGNLYVLRKIDGQFERVGLEADPLSQWLFFALRDAGMPAICVETRHMKVAIPAMANKNDCNDARSIAQVIRPG
jgi:transposase